MEQKQIDEIQASVNEAIQQARRKVEELLTAIDGALAVGTFVDLGSTRSEAERALSTLPKTAPKLYEPALVITGRTPEKGVMRQRHWWRSSGGPG